MLRLLKLILSATIISFALSSSNKVQLIKSSITWHNAFLSCTEQNSTLADITELSIGGQNHICNSINKNNVNNMFWVGSFYKLSKKISIEGCYNIPPDVQILHAEGYKTLHDCFELCSGMTNKSGLFAHQASVTSFCICDLPVENGAPKNISMVPLLHCSTNPQVSNWWVYKINSNDLNTGNESCRKLTCTDQLDKNNNSTKTLCGQLSRHFDLKGPIPEDHQPYVCERTSARSTNSNKSILVDYFRFALKASILNDEVEKPVVCKAITCTAHFNFSISLHNCSTTTSGFFCIKEKNVSIESSKSSSTTRSTSPTTSTISNFITASLKQQTKNASYDTNASRIMTISTLMQQTSDVPFHSSLDNFNNSQVVSTFPSSSSTVSTSRTTKLHITPSLKYSSSYTSSYTTDLNEMKHLASITTMASLETMSNGHSEIGLIVGSAVATITIIVAVVLLVSCRLRHLGPFRKKKFVDNIEINELNDSNVQDDNSITSTCNVHNTMYDMHTPSSDNTTFGLLDVYPNNSNNTRNDEYAVVVKNNLSGNLVVEQNCDTNGSKSNDLVESKADMINHVRYSSGNNSSNIRDNEYAVVVKNNHSGNQVIEQNVGMNAEHSDDLMESEYDRLNHVRPRSANNTSTIYDSALGFREECDATYNMTDYNGSVKRDYAVYDHT